MVHQQEHPEEAKDSRTEGRREEEEDGSGSETAAALRERGQNSDAASTGFAFLIQRSWKGETGP